MRLTVKNKLQIGFGVILLFLLIISGIGMFYLNENNQMLDQIDKDQKIAGFYNDIAFHAVRANAAIRGYMLYEKEEMKDNHYEIRAELHEAINHLKNAGIDNTEFSTYLQQLDEWENGVDNDILPLLKTDRKAAEQAALPILGEGSRLLVVFGKQMANEVAADIDHNISLAKQSGQGKFNMMLGLSLFAIVMSFSISTLFGTRIAQNINKVVLQMSEFSNGNFLTKLNLNTKDEFEQLSNSFNTMTEQLRKTMQNVGDSSEQVAATAEELTANSHEVSHATEIVTASVQEISHGIEQQNQMTTNANLLSTNVKDKMKQITSNVESVNQSAKETKKLADKGQVSVQNIVEQIDIISNNTQALTNDVKELDANTRTITEAVDVIKKIAEQTNLVAINASIEAARSGEHGKGFAVVAMEVRNLADESNHAAIEIEKMVETITAHTKKFVQDIIVNDESVNIGRARVETAQLSFTKIDQSFDLVQQQNLAVTNAVHLIAQDIEELVQEISEIYGVSEQSNDSVQSVAASTEEQMASMEEIAAASAHLAEMAIQLQETIQTFKY